MDGVTGGGARRGELSTELGKWSYEGGGGWVEQKEELGGWSWFGGAGRVEVGGCCWGG